MSESDTMNQFRLDGRVALITGGSRGLGLSMATGLAQAGAVTVLCSRKAAEAQQAAASIRKETGRESVGLAGDVTDEASVSGLVQSVVSRFGRLDVLVNSAGVNIRHPVEEFPPAEFRQIIDTNLTGTWLCCRAVAPVLREHKRGSVINVGSALGAIGIPERSAYCASKAGVLGMTRVLALEWAPFGVRCNALCPGPFLTEINRPLLAHPEKVQAVVGQTAFNRWGELFEIRGAAVFLASDASSYMTGSALYVDGGWTAH